jgi:quercetin dioxygenase-like cupin family protein
MRASALLAWTFGAALAATWVGLEVSRAQQPPAPPYKVIQLMKAPFTADPNKETVMIRVEWPPNVSTPWHTHPGDEYATVLEGSVISQIEGGEPKKITVGQSYHNPAGAVHMAKSGDTATTTIAIFVVEKGKPLLQPVTK